MKSLNKKIGAVALSGMVVFGGFAASGVNVQAYSPDLIRQVEDLGRGTEVFHKVKNVAEEYSAKVEAVFSSKAKMNNYVESKYWSQLQRRNPNAKKAKKALSVGVECGNNPKVLEEKIQNIPPGNRLRLRYQGYYFLIRVNGFNSISDIPDISSSDIENLDRHNQRFFYQYVKPFIEKAGFRVIKIYDYNKQNREKMKNYIQDRFEDGVFKGNDKFKERLSVGLGCVDYRALLFNLEHPYDSNIIRLNHQGIDMLLVRK